jgi:uncharacterized membrane protein
MFRQLFTEHPGKTIGVIAGLILGILFIFIGFFNTLVVVVFVTAGLYIGSKFDNRENLMDVLDRILPGKYTRH